MVLLTNILVCFCLSVVLIVVSWWHGMMYAESLAEFFTLLWNEVCACIWHYSTGQSILWRDYVTCLYYIICTEPFLACLVLCMILSCLWAVVPGNQEMYGNFHSLLCQHSSQSSRWICIAAALSSQYQCDLCAGGSAFYLRAILVLFFCLSL